MCVGHDGAAFLPPFPRLSGHLLDLLGMSGRVRSLGAGQVVWWEGDSGTDVLVLESGRLRAARAGVDGHETTLFVVEPVSLLGIEALTGGHGHDATLSALRPSTVRLIPHRALRAAMDASPAIADEVFRILATDLRRANERHVRMNTCDVRQRLLLWLRERAVNDVDRHAHPDARVVIDRTQGELADELWTTRSTLNRVIHDLELTGEIRLEGDVIVLNRPESARRASERSRAPTAIPAALQPGSTRSASS